MKRKTLILVAIVVAVVGLIVAANWQVISMLPSRPSIGGVTESWETSNQTFKIHVDRHAEENGGFVPGAYYVFRSAPSGSDSWREVMTFRHDDPVSIPRNQVRFVNDQVGYVFMGWMYAVTTDGGASWSVWDAKKNLPNWKCCNYGLVKDVSIASDGTGTMTFDVIDSKRGEVPKLHTTDFGKHWNP